MFSAILTESASGLMKNRDEERRLAKWGAEGGREKIEGVMSELMGRA